MKVFRLRNSDGEAGVFPRRRLTPFIRPNMLRTRRYFLTSSGLVILFPSAALPAEAWVDKHPDQWTSEDVEKVLNHSGWVREVMLAYLPSTAPGSHKVETPSEFTAQVRWESALPIRLARKFVPGPAAFPEKSYALSINNLPVAFLADSLGGVTGRLGQDDDRAKQAIAAQLTQNAVLQRDGQESIRATRADWISADFKDSILVTFPAGQHPIQLSDHDVTFFSQIGVFVVRTSFSLRRMTYRGKLEV
jgi:hypothetical protein